MNKQLKNVISAILCIVMVVGGIKFFNILNNEFHAASMIGYFTKADTITYYGHHELVPIPGDTVLGNKTIARYTNTSEDSEKYVVYSNAVVGGDGSKYDLVIYPFKKTQPADFTIKMTTGNYPSCRIKGSGYYGFKLVITEHGNRNKPINMNILFGMSDLDDDEYIELPSNYSIIHKGDNISTSNSSNISGGTKYLGTVRSSTDALRYRDNCIIGNITVPTNGITVYYGNTNSDETRGALLAFDQIKDNSYLIEFDANGGTGQVPSTIAKYGTSSSTVMGNIGSTIPTRSGYAFKGWSASTSGTQKVAYSSIEGAAQTADSWTYQNYCDNTGGNSSNRILTLYAQWETYTYTINFDANGGTGNVPASITRTGADSSVVMGDIGGVVPTRSDYIFKGWSASSIFNSKRIAYTSGNTGATQTSSSWSYATYCSNTGGDSSNRTLTLYAQWEYAPSYTHTLAYDANGGSGAPSSSTVTNTSSTYNMTVSSTQPTRTGYTFSGWNTNSSGTGTDYSAGGSVSVGANATVTLYAKWTLNSSILKVNPNGGTWNGSLSEQLFTQNYNTTKDIPVPTRTGYTFTGWTRSGTNGTMSSLTAAATYTFGSADGTTDTITAGWTANNYTVTYIDRISGTTTNLGSSTASKPYGSTVKGSDKGSSTTVGAYYTGYYYVSDTSATVTTSGATVYRYFSPQNYTVTYIDVVESTSGKELGRQTESKPYNSTVKGIDIGASTADNAYYKNYALIEGTNGYTTAVVDSSNNTVVYRYFKWLTKDISGTVNWTDAHNAYGTRPDKVKIVIFQNGIPVSSVVTVSGTKDIEPVILSTAGDINSFTFPDMPAYDNAGYPYTYDVRMYDLDAAPDIKNPSSVMSLEYPESKYVTTQNGYDIYNVLDNNVPDTPPGGFEGFTVNGAIHWVDSGNKLGLRPSTVTIELYQDGKPFMVNGEHYMITVDAINDNTYKFIKLPKYKYVDGQPVPYEYTTAEKIVSNYVKDGVIYPLYDIHTDENMGKYEKLHFTNYIKIDGPIIPIVPPDERTNTITVITNTEDKVDIVLKMLDFYITELPEDVNVQYGPGYNGDEYNLSVSELGEIIKHLPSGKYEIDIKESKYELKDIHISDNTDNVYITYEDGKYYLVVDHVPGDSWGTVNIEFEKKAEYYQARESINNYFKAPFAKRIVGGYIELPEDRDVSVVKKLMLRNYLMKAVSDPVSAELPEMEETTETSTSEIEDTEDEQDTEESTFIIEEESEETDSSKEDLENDSSSETPDIIVSHWN